MAIGDTVSGFTATFQPAAGIQVIIFFSGVPIAASSTGITDGGSTSIVYVPLWDPVLLNASNSRGISVFKIPIDNTNYFTGPGGYSGIQTKWHYQLAN